MSHDFVSEKKLLFLLKETCALIFEVLCTRAAPGIIEGLVFRGFLSVPGRHAMLEPNLLFYIACTLTL